MIEVSNRVFAAGNANFLKAVVIPLVEYMEIVSSEYPCKDEEPPRQNPIRPQADATGICGIVGVSFIIAWAMTKVFDEIWLATISPKIRQLLTKYFHGNKSQKKYAVAISTHVKDDRITIFTVCIGKTVKEIEESLSKIRSVLEMAKSNVNPNEKNKVHMYLVEGGSCNVEPIKFNNHEDAMRSLSSMHPVTPPRYQKLNQSS